MTCGGSFPANCGFQNNTRYKCTGIGATPSSLHACTKECLFTSPDNTCRLDCALQVLNATDQIQAIIDELGLISIVEIDPITNTPFTIGNNVTAVAIPLFITLLNVMKASSTVVKDSADQLALIAGQISKTANGTAVVFQRIRSTLPEKQNVLIPVVQEMLKLLPLLDKVIECSGSNGSDYSGFIRLYHDFVDASINHMQNLAVPPMDVTMTKLMCQVQNAYGDSSDVLELIYQSASEALKCHGLNVTMFGDKCSSYGDRTKGFLSYILQWLKSVIGLWRILGWITDPIMDAIYQAVQDVLTAASDTIVGVLGTIATLLDLIKIIAPGNYQEDISNFALKLVGIEAIAGDSGGKKTDCFGAITLVMAILRVIPKFADKITFCTATGITIIDVANPLCAAGNILNGVLNMAEGVLRTAAGFISTGLGALLDGVYSLICTALLRVAAVCDILQFLKEAVKKIVSCLIDQDKDLAPSFSAATTVYLTFL
ncbi:hypothetical protein BGZ59_007706 [Podila verticillata]|nr:hypothetical protein BGZ59_007706 [Podila verticillata]